MPGGLSYRTDLWLVEHGIGPLGLVTLILRPERQVTAVLRPHARRGRRTGSVQDGHGPRLQMARFEAGIAPDAADVAEVADQARRLFLAGRKSPATHD